MYLIDTDLSENINEWDEKKYEIHNDCAVKTAVQKRICNNGSRGHVILLLNILIPSCMSCFKKIMPINPLSLVHNST